MVGESVQIKKTDIPCTQCCNTHETQKQGRYVANRCDEEAMRECSCWQYRDKDHALGYTDWLSKGDSEQVGPFPRSKSYKTQLDSREII